MKYLSRGAHLPRLPEPPLNDGAWELIRSCWVREASNRPRIEEVTKRMVRASPDPSYEAKIGSEKLDETSNKRRKNEARYNRPIGSRPLTKHNAKSSFLVLLIIELSNISLFPRPYGVSCKSQRSDLRSLWRGINNWFHPDSTSDGLQEEERPVWRNQGCPDPRSIWPTLYALIA